MILMPVSDDDSLYLVLPLGKEADIRQNFGHPQILETAGNVKKLKANCVQSQGQL